MTRLIVIAAAGLLSACGQPEVCDDAPTVTWDNFGRGFTTQNCQACHASESVDRNGAPPDITFDSEEALLEHIDLVLDEATGDSPTMPPQGGVEEDDRYRLEVMLRCGG